MAKRPRRKRFISAINSKVVARMVAEAEKKILEKLPPEKRALRLLSQVHGKPSTLFPRHETERKLRAKLAKQKAELAELTRKHETLVEQDSGYAKMIAEADAKIVRTQNAHSTAMENLGRQLSSDERIAGLIASLSSDLDSIASGMSRVGREHDAFAYRHAAARAAQIKQFLTDSIEHARKFQRGAVS